LFNTEISRIEKEINILQISNCNRIVKYIDHFQENYKMYIVTEYYRVSIILNILNEYLSYKKDMVIAVNNKI